MATGVVEGEAGGFLFFGIFPIARNSMLECAYQKALDSKNADYILSPALSDRWFWTPFGNGFKRGTSTNLRTTLN